MSKPIIEIQALSKKYDLGVVRPKTLRDAWDHLWNKPVSAKTEELWALKDVSFEVKPGEVIGIVGRNGAGKSTLLKILSRITEPTSGRAVLRGRVSSLLEVGTGFHPELSGRENIYLNGTILGMRKSEIDRKFDEIVAFSEIEKFIDTPVKHYSSGMYVRLAFAVAAHLDPEILLVDEVLAVGDVGFQQKCLGQIGRISEQGRTIVFVSHNITALKKICRRGLLISEGRLIYEGGITETVNQYLRENLPAEEDGFGGKRIHNCGYLKISEADLFKDQKPQRHFCYGDEVEVRMTVISEKEDVVGIEIVIKDETGTPIIFLPSGLRFGKNFKIQKGENRFLCYIPKLPLAEGKYYLDLMVAHSGAAFLDYLESALSFEIILSDPCGVGSHYIQRRGQGSVHIDAEFVQLKLSRDSS